MENSKNALHKMPKPDVHNHLHLSADVNAVNKKYPDLKLTPPIHYDGLDGMIHFIETEVNRILRTSDDALFFMQTAIETSIRDNVTYLEASVDINLVRLFNGCIDAFIDSVAFLKEKYSAHIQFRPDIGINKESAIALAFKNGFRCIESGVFNGIDLYGRELDVSLNSYKKLYDYARDYNLKTKVHIGEFSDHHSIEHVINVLHPNEIQHGISAADSAQTMDLLIENSIQLNICPQSNIHLGAVPTLLEHPIRKLFDHGVTLTLNTDDFLLFNSSLTDQYFDLLEQKIFSMEELNTIRNNGFPSNLKQ